ncbi:MAG: KpsF/GutQ family sugar-phosphate isomerase, partial [Candidatus Omnitrophica bacterium]|nr:KpsF/GutQ family sugar-phosphate isomerase [Candidatus Omnitrophota bacterium]
MKRQKILKLGQKIIDTEIRALKQVRRRLGKEFIQTIRLIQGCRGKIVVTGMGKSGIIGRKIAGTMSSTGTTAVFLHPGEAIHGDLGLVTKGDIILAISNSGESDEILRILPAVKKIGARIVALTSSSESTLARASDVVISTGPVQEADDFGLVPSSSTTCALVLGDALALTLLALSSFDQRDYALYHPGGNLGKRLMLKVRDVMQTGKQIPVTEETVCFPEALKVINEKNLGFTLVVNNKQQLVGIITDGDVRRLLLRHGENLSCLQVKDIMTKNPKT